MYKYMVTVEHHRDPKVEEFEVLADTPEEAKDTALEKAFEFFNDWLGDDEIVDVECVGEEDDE